MRIAYLTQSYPPMISGAAILVERLAKSMAMQGHQVLVIAASDRGAAYISYAENLTEMRLRSLHNPFRVSQRFLLYPRFKVLQALKDFGPDIIHTHEPFMLGKLGLEHARRSDIPILLTLHQLPWFAATYLPDWKVIRSMTESILWRYARRMSQRCSAVIAPSQTVSDLITSRTGVQTVTISNGISLQVFQSPSPMEDQTAIRARLGLPSGVPVILHVGRLDIDKNVERVVQAAVPVLQKTDAHLLIVGDGRQKNQLTEQCEMLNITDRVHFPGYISLHEGLPEIYRLASVFITASEIEVQSLVLLEAIASGLPIVAVRATFVPEVVRDGVNGFLAESGDVDRLSRSLTFLLKHPELREEMGKHSRILAEMHDIRYSIDLHEQLYAGLMKQTRVQPVLQKRQLQDRWTRIKGRTEIGE